MHCLVDVGLTLSTGSEICSPNNTAASHYEVTFRTSHPDDFIHPLRHHHYNSQIYIPTTGNAVLVLHYEVTFHTSHSDDFIHPPHLSTTTITTQVQTSTTGKTALLANYEVTLHISHSSNLIHSLHHYHHSTHTNHW